MKILRGNQICGFLFRVGRGAKSESRFFARDLPGFGP
jgi:hypothetical protein